MRGILGEMGYFSAGLKYFPAIYCHFVRRSEERDSSGFTNCNVFEYEESNGDIQVTARATRLPDYAVFQINSAIFCKL